MVWLGQKTQVFESRTRKELRQLLFGYPVQKLSEKDFKFLTGALLADAAELPFLRRILLSSSIRRLKRECEGRDSEDARGSLQEIWKRVHAASAGPKLPFYCGTARTADGGD